MPAGRLKLEAGRFTGDAISRSTLGVQRSARGADTPTNWRHWRLQQPIRASPKFAKASSIVWMTPNEWPGAWMPLGRVCVIGFGKRGSAGTRARGVRKGIPPLAIPAAEGRKKPAARLARLHARASPVQHCMHCSNIQYTQNAQP